MIAVTSAAPVYRAGIETGGTTYTFQRVPEVLPAQVPAPAVVHQYDMHFLSRTRSSEMAGISSDRLSRGTACKQPEKYAQVLTFRYQLFNAHTGDVYIGQMGPHICIAFIGAYDKFTRLRDGKIYTGQRRSAGKE